jgi:hypothetical protein
MCAGNSVNQHYRQKLDPSLNNGPYLPEEDEIILKHVQEHLSKGRDLNTVPWVECADRLKRSSETLPSEWRMHFVGAVSTAFVAVLAIWYHGSSWRHLPAHKKNTTHTCMHTHTRMSWSNHTLCVRILHVCTFVLFRACNTDNYDKPLGTQSRALLKCVQATLSTNITGKSWTPP